MATSKPTSDRQRNYEDELLYYMEKQKEHASRVRRIAKTATHPRYGCDVYPFDADTGYEKFCPKCYCFVCEVRR